MADALCQKRPSRCVRDAIAIMVHGIDGRVVEQADLRQDIKCPGRLLDKAERGRPVPNDRSAAGLLEGVLALAHVFPERFRGHDVNAAVVPTVARHLMSRLVDGANQLGVIMGDLADDEERGRDVPLRELLEDPTYHPAHASVVIVLQRGCHLQTGRRLDAVVLLDVEAENGGDRVGTEPIARDTRGGPPGARRGRYRVGDLCADIVHELRGPLDAYLDLSDTACM